MYSGNFVWCRLIRRNVRTSQICINPQDVRVVHAIVQNIYEYSLKRVSVYRWHYSQNVNAPAMTPLAMFTGKMRYARRVIGNDSAKNNGGGITSRSLYKGKVSNKVWRKVERQRRDELIHRQIVVDPMR